MSKHTPGPLVRDGKHQVRDQKGKKVANCAAMGRTYSERKANSILFASASDLLEQLEDMLSSLKVLGINGLDTEIKNATAVVARARGEA